MPTLEPMTQQFVDALAQAGGPPIYTLGYAEARQVLLGAQSGPVTRPAADVEDTCFPVGPTGAVEVRITRPAGSTARLPVVIYLHGGGWVLGNRDTHDRLVREIAVGANVAVVFVDYIPAPEAQFPTQPEQAYAATEYVVRNAEELNVDASRLAIVGDSAGGNLVAAVTLMAKERGGPQARAQVLFYPVTDLVAEDGSYAEFAEGPWLTKKAMEWFFDAYAPSAEARSDIRVAPSRATTEQLRDLPPALVMVAENDVLRNEGEAYARKLAEAGVRTVAVRYDGAIHDFAMLNGLSETPAARAAIAQATAYLRDALEGGAS